jgi:hypothetical protein
VKKYTFDDPDNLDYEIIIPDENVRQIIDDYNMKTFYISVGMLCFIVGMLFGILIS